MALYRYNVFATFMLMFLPDFCSAFQSLLTLNDRVYVGESGWVRAVNQFEFLNYIYVSKCAYFKRYFCNVFLRG